jgi:hypothetical protein
MPTIKDVATRLHGAKVVTKLDAKNRFWIYLTRYIQIEKELLSIVFTCERFNTHLWTKVSNSQDGINPWKTLSSSPYILHLNTCKGVQPRIEIQEWQRDVPGRHCPLSRAYLHEVNV